MFLYANDVNTLRVGCNVGGGGWQADNWDASGVTAGTTYLVEIEYNSTQITVGCDGIVRMTVTYTGGIDWGANIPDTIYIGQNASGVSQGDAVFSAP